MKKIIFLFSILALFSLLPLISSAAPIEPPNLSIDIWTFLSRLLNWFFGIVVILAAIMLVWAGATYITATGDEKKVKKALDTLIYALVGVGIAILAKGLVYMVCNFVNVGGQCNFI